MKTTITILAAAILLTACADRKLWVRPNTTNEQYQRDLIECDAEGLKASIAIQGTIEHDWKPIVLSNQCLVRRGYK